MISVIIPCYRGENNVGRMIKAILGQSYQDIEVLVVGNGPGQDAQRKVVESFFSMDERVRYLSLSEAGVSRARNFGLDNAHGEWVSFVDDDDIVPEDWLSRFAAHFDKKPDLIAGGIRCLPFGASDPTDTDVSVPAEGFYSNESRDFLPVFSSDVAVRYSPCSKIIRRTFLNENKIRFDETLTVCEDCVFSQEIALKAGSMCFIPQTGYLYIARKGSAAGRYHESMERALTLRRSLLCRVAERSGMSGSELDLFRRSQVVADSLDVFLNVFREGSPYGFGGKVTLLDGFFSDDELVKAVNGVVPPLTNKPLFVYMWFFRIKAKVAAVLFFGLAFAIRNWMRKGI